MRLWLRFAANSRTVKNRSVNFGQGKTSYPAMSDFGRGIAFLGSPYRSDPLAKHGLTYRFRTEANGPALKVTCIIFAP